MRPADQVIEAAREMLNRGLTTGTVGNVSVRDGDAMLITPTRRHPQDLCPADLVRVGLAGGEVSPPEGPASQEWLMHAAIYRARPDVGAVVHTHSPNAIARSFDPSPLVVRTEERVYLGLERIEVAPHGDAGSEELAAGAVAALGDRATAMLARHGVVGTGADPRAALELCAAVEHQAVIDLALSRT